MRLPRSFIRVSRVKNVAHSGSNAAIDGTFLGAVACDQMATLPLILWDGD
jgi:hypothetical protein